MTVSNTKGERWTILNVRYGGSFSNPTDEQLAQAIEELYVEQLPDMTEEDYEEHGMAFLCIGYDEGPMYEMEITRGREVWFEEWPDQDEYEHPLVPPRMMEDVSQEHALQLWKLLSLGLIEEVRQQPWVETT